MSQSEEAALQDPDWIARAGTQTWHELKLYLRTLRAVTFSPRAFARAWAQGEELMAPLTFFATSLALNVGLRQAASAWVGVNESGGFWLGVRDSVLPYASYLAIALTVHPLMRWLGSGRRLRSTIAIALYAGGGPACLVRLAVIPLVAAVVRVFHFQPLGEDVFEVPPDAVPIAIALAASVFVAMLAYFVCFSLALAELHQVKLRKATPALLGALLVASAMIAAFRSTHPASARAGHHGGFTLTLTE